MKKILSLIFLAGVLTAGAQVKPGIEVLRDNKFRKPSGANVSA